MASGKRAAGTELNHDNWNDEEISEDAGEFKKASEEEIQRRVRKIAKRRIVNNDSETPAANPFVGFGGFKTNSGLVTSTPATTFSFLSKIPSTTITPKTNGAAETTKEKTSSNTEYFSKIKALNVAVSDWIKTHVDDNPLCILTPVFKDYEKYLKEFEDLKKFSKQPEVITQGTMKEKESAALIPTSSFSFGKPSVPASSTSTSTNSSVFTDFKFGGDAQKASPLAHLPKPITGTPENKGGFFGSRKSLESSQPCTATSTFSFGLKNPSETTTPLFGGLSKASATFSFGNVVQAPKTDEASKDSKEEDADEEPPKNEFVPVVEDDSLYSKRCKVFVKSGTDYADRGIGTLYIKKIEDLKIQLIVRADTNLGNILLNILIIDGLPVSRVGKNNVMVVCIPTPESKPPPTSVLLRVKTETEADELLATINKYKK
ncbi:CLUMA_CG015225, isoform A [Clunio marinus]|uniref:CLUMA_CG015225, isoform A n=1 Tax=Clunio marinus TaxID=568069 RepID=A0A1J1IVE1_9DIPT|nr:CLUMA_CG015225, isoform A [Clunio marinus]